MSLKSSLKIFFSRSLKKTEKTETKEVFTFQFLSDKIYSYTVKSHLALDDLAKFVSWLILSLKIEK